MNVPKILACYFDAPIQSYGIESRFDRRTTLPYPTRSVVSGIICAAMGINRDDVVFLRKFAELKLVVLELPRKKYQQSKYNQYLAICDLRDYHTVGGGYEGSKDEKLFTPRSSVGTKSDTVQSYRDYLADARFGVLISGDDAQIEKIDAALKDPIWGVWFGRKCCVPASPISQGVFDNFDSAVKILCERAGCDKPRRVVRDAKSYNEDGSLSYWDVPRSFAQSRRGTGEQFGIRRIVVESWDDFLNNSENFKNADI